MLPPRPDPDPMEGITYDPVTGRINPTEDGRELTDYTIPLYQRKPMILHDSGEDALPGRSCAPSACACARMASSRAGPETSGRPG